MINSVYLAATSAAVNIGPACSLCSLLQWGPQHLCCRRKWSTPSLRVSQVAVVARESSTRSSERLLLEPQSS
eukprot:2101946-Amphidinium_carterae.1